MWCKAFGGCLTIMLYKRERIEGLEPNLWLLQLERWWGQHIKFYFGHAELDLSGRDLIGVTEQAVQHTCQYF